MLDQKQNAPEDQSTANKSNSTSGKTLPAVEETKPVEEQPAKVEESAAPEADQETAAEPSLFAYLFGLEIEFSGVSLKDGVLSAESFTETINVGDNAVTLAINGAFASSTGELGWKDASFTIGNVSIGGILAVNNLTGTVSGDAGHAITGSGELVIDLAGASVSGTVNVAYDETGWAVTSIESGNLTAAVLGQTFEVADISYEDGVIAASSGTMNLDVFGNQATVVVNNISLDKDKVFQWENASFTAGDINLGGILQINGLTGTVTGDAAHEVTGTGDVGLTIPGAEAAGTVNVKYEEGTGFELVSIENGSVTASLLNGNATVVGSDITYDENGLAIGTSDITLATGGLAPGLGDINGTVNNITYSNGAFDWESITLNINKEYELGALKFGLGTAQLDGKANNYLITINDATAGVSIGKWFSADGSASFSWSIMEGKSPEIDKSSLTFEGKSPELPKDFIPGLLPIDYGIVFPFALGPVPMEAELGLKVDAGASVTIGGNMNYEGNKYVFSVDSKGTGFLEMGLRASISIGSSLFIALGLFLEGNAKATLEAGVGLEGEATQVGNKFDFSKVNATYSLDADVIAQLIGGIKTTALLIFKKTLYQVKIKEWNLGHASKSGSLNLLSGAAKEESSGGMLKKGAAIPSAPVFDEESKKHLINDTNKETARKKGWFK